MKGINMGYTPKDIYNYIVENDLIAAFMVSLTLHKQDFTIAEITDAKYRKKEDGYYLTAPSYKINIKLEDDDVLTALMNELYVSSFISKYNNQYNVHFLVHTYPTSMKAQFDEQILDEVVRYMIMNTIIRLRLDTPEKIDKYIK